MTTAIDLALSAEELKNHPAYLRHLLDASGECFYAVNRDGETTLCNAAFLRTMKFDSEADVIGRKLHGAIHHSHPDGSHYDVMECPIYRCARDGVPAHVTGEFFFPPEGAAIPVEYRAHPIYIDGRLQGAICTFQDVSERWQAEESLRRGEEQFRELANLTPGQIWRADGEGRAIYMGQQFYDYTGAAPGSALGPGWLGWLHPADAPVALKRWKAAIAARSSYESEFRIRDRSGGFQWFSVQARPLKDKEGNVLSWLAVNTNISRLKQVEQSLTELTESLEKSVAERTRERDQIWRTSRDFLIIIDKDGLYKLVNPAWSQVFGLTEAEIVGTHFNHFVHPDDRALVERHYIELLGGKEVVEFEARKRTAEGSYRRISWIVVRQDEDLYASGRDVTGQRILEEQLRQSQKMEAVGQLTGGLAHDFNNLLTGISGSLELLNIRLEQGRYGDLPRYIAVAQNAARRAAALTHRMLAFSRRQTLDPKPVNVNRLVADMEDLIRRTAGPAITVEVVGAAGLWIALVDGNQLENSLLNLCINARDAMPEGGRLTIETANKWLDDRVARAHELPPGQYLSLCVTDTGSGMAPEIVARAFDPFFTTKPIGEGTGLGLSMVYGFAKQSGGQARIYSEIGLGTTVCIYLPRHADTLTIEEAASPDAPLPRAREGETVLIVDDEPAVRMLAAEVLSDLGYAALEAADGVEGLRIMQSDARIDLLVTDVGLPGGINGRQLADAAREKRPNLKVLFVTGYAENAVMSHGHLPHGMHVLTKPFTISDFGKRIKDMIGLDTLGY